MSPLIEYIKNIFGIILAFVIGTGAYDAIFYSLKGDNSTAIIAIIALEIVVLLTLGAILILALLQKTNYLCINAITVNNNDYRTDKC
jgi:uncharacterized membrane protein YbhN (UPF0104 family)